MGTTKTCVLHFYIYPAVLEMSYNFVAFFKHFFLPFYKTFYLQEYCTSTCGQLIHGRLGQYFFFTLIKILNIHYFHFSITIITNYNAVKTRIYVNMNNMQVVQEYVCDDEEEESAYKTTSEHCNSQSLSFPLL